MFWPQIINFLSNHFELIIASNILAVIIFVTIFFMSRVREFFTAHWLMKAGRNFLYYSVMLAQAATLLVMAWIFIDNRGERPILDDRAFYIESNTDWVKDKLDIYVIAGKDLVTLQPNGQERRVVLQAEAPIREYHFSPDGEIIAVITDNALTLVDRKTGAGRVILSLASGNENEARRKSVINAFRWSPDSTRFCYRLARWSQYSSEDRWFVYSVAEKKEHVLDLRGLNVAYLEWDADGRSLYFPWFETLNKKHSANPYQFKLYRISLEKRQPELILQAFWDKPFLSEENLAMRGIRLFTGWQKLSFGLSVKNRYSAFSSKGERIGISPDDHLWHSRGKWWRRRLLKIPRLPAGDLPYEQRPLVLDHLRWFPSGRYVMMEHYLYGVLIMDPVNNKLGILTGERGATYGWYEPPG